MDRYKMYYVKTIKAINIKPAKQEDTQAIFVSTAN